MLHNSTKNIPVYIWDLYEGSNFYGFPRQHGPPGGVKVAIHSSSSAAQTICTPQTIDRSVSDAEVVCMREILGEHIPSLAGEVVASATCMYTVTPDEHFLIDFHPSSENIILASPCSGHGFKFCTVIGEILADLVEKGFTEHDISLFSFKQRS